MVLWVLIALFSVSATFSDFYALNSYDSYYQPLLESKIAPDNMILVFDWHKVIQEQNFARIASKLFSPKKKYIWQAARPQLWFMIRHLVKEKVVAEKIIERIESTFPSMIGLKKLFIQAVNEEPIIEDTVKIIEKLKSAGFKIYMLSNIAAETLENLWFIHSDVLKNFDGIYTPSNENNYMQKPNPEFYKKFKDYLKKCGEADKNILFIDDREKNIKAAVEQGFYGIVFSSSEQLISQMNSLQFN